MSVSVVVSVSVSVVAGVGVGAGAGVAVRACLLVFACTHMYLLAYHTYRHNALYIYMNLYVCLHI